MSRDRERRRWGLNGFDLGISLGGAVDRVAWERVLDWVDRAEELGLHSVWVPEMHFVAGGSASPLLALSAFASRSKRLRLGTTSLLLPIHEPRRLADEIAGLDTLSQGRTLLGLGRGFRAPLFSAFGIDPAAKRDRFDSALDTILAHWRGDDAAASDGPCLRPVQSPHPPLAVAAFGRKGLLQAARRGLPYLASPMEPIQLVAENLRFHREHLPPDIEPDEVVVPVMRTLHVAADDAEVRRVRQGLEAESRQLRGRVPRALARAAAAELDERVIVGTSERVVDTLGEQREALGMDLLIVRPEVTGASQAEKRDSLSRLAREVWPALSSRVPSPGRPLA